MTETYTSGRWIVKAGEEDAFVEEWTSFVTWASEMPAPARSASCATSTSEKFEPSTLELVTRGA